MCANERRLWMPCNHTVPLFKQGGFGDGRTVKTPIRMGSQFFKSLVESVDRSEECIRIGRMKHNRDAQFCGFVKDRSEPLVIDTEQRATCIPHRETQILPELDAAGSVFYQCLESIQRYLRKVTALNVIPIHPSDGGKSIRRDAMKLLNGVDRSLPRLHGDVDDLLHTALVHHTQHILRGLGIEMVVVVNNRKSGPLDLMRGNRQRRAWSVVTQAEIDFLLGIHHGNELIFAARVLVDHASPSITLFPA